MNADEPDFDDAAGDASLPFDADDHRPEALRVIAEVLESLDLQHIELDEEAVRVPIQLSRVDVQLVASAVANGHTIKVGVRLPLRVPEENRAAAGEFLHRMNAELLRQPWGLDYDSGFLRMDLVFDNFEGQFNDDYFRAMMHYVLNTVDTVFPYLSGVINGHLRAALAADQAQAALSARESEEGDDEEAESDEEAEEDPR